MAASRPRRGRSTSPSRGSAGASRRWRRIWACASSSARPAASRSRTSVWTSMAMPAPPSPRPRRSTKPSRASRPSRRVWYASPARSIQSGCSPAPCPACWRVIRSCACSSSSANRRIDIIEEGIDIAVRVRERLDTDADLQVKQLGHSCRCWWRAPPFVAAHGSPASPQEIPSFPTLGHTDRPGADRWSLINAAGEEAVVTHEPRLAASAFPVLREGAVAGVGIAMLPDAACVRSARRRAAGSAASRMDFASRHRPPRLHLAAGPAAERANSPRFPRRSARPGGASLDAARCLRLC
jgi:hypothetical protein